MLDAKLSGIDLKWRYGKSKVIVGWRAKEIIEGGRHSKYSNMFSLGCVISYCVLGSHRLFGANHEVESNVVDFTPYKDLLSFFSEASHLVLAIVKTKFEERNKCSWVLSHPFFWDSKKRVGFFQDVNTWLSDSNDNVKMNFRASCNKGFRNWNHEIRLKLARFMIKRRAKTYEFNYNYNYNELLDLLRFIEDTITEFHYLSPSLKKFFEDDIIVGSDKYFSEAFPSLLMELHKYCLTRFGPEMEAGNYAFVIVD